MDGILIHDATREDVLRMTQLRSTAAMHADRVAQADGLTWRYLAVEHAGAIAGWGCLIFSQPKLWPSCKQMPRLIDLFIAPTLRGQGIGAHLIAYMEAEIAARGFNEVFISVDPTDNRRAWALYERLGYAPLGEPEWTSWEYVDSSGQRHCGEGWDVTLSKKLQPTL